jgi:4-hydroxy-3-polyprenylbenzoate decarboxylase
LIIITNDSEFASYSVGNFLWVTFTRSDPAQDIYGVDSFIEKKHWGCKGPLIIDARIKPHHAPVLKENPAVLKRIEWFGIKGASLYGYI